MRKLSYAVVPISVVLAFVLYLITSGGSKSESEIIEKPAAKVLTRVDSLVLSYDTLVHQMLDSANAVGAALVITHKGEILHTMLYGVKEDGTRDSIDEHTIFRLASVSKTITGVLAGILDSEEQIKLDDRVIDYLPSFRLKDSVNTYDLRIRHILSHTSGLVPHAYDNLVEAHVPFSTIMDSLFRVNISAEPGVLYGYQNVMFSLYDTITAIQSGQSFESLLDEKLFRPFGMHDASAGFSAFSNSSNKGLPHRRSGVGYRPMRLNDRYYLTNPAAGINASISDMGSFLLALGRKDPHLLNPQVADTVLSPQVISPLRRVYLRHWDRVDSKHYGLGWRIIGYKGRQLGYHGGYVSGYRAEIAICREENIGIAFLTNSPGRVGSEIIPRFLDSWFEASDSLKEIPSDQY